MNSNFRDFVIGLVATVALIVAFSTGCFSEDLFPRGENMNPKYPGDSGIVISGKGSDMADVITRFEAVKVEIQEPSESMTKAESETQTDVVADNKKDNKKKTEGNRMVNIAVSFWHGVAAVLIGEAAALMVATAYLKIRLAYLKIQLTDEKKAE